ncbi:MAG: hypothetical protein ABI397_03230 [Candidatus Saccharimonas sp.]
MPTKKTTKKLSKKQPTRIKHVSVSQTHVMIKRSLLGYAIIVFVVFCTISMSVYLVERMVVSHNIENRYDEMSKVYTDLNLDKSYLVDQTNISGSSYLKAVDGSKVYNSIVSFGHNDTVSATISDLTTRLEQAGFNPAGTRYEGTVASETNFKNNDGVVVTINVVTKSSHDMSIYGVPTLDEWQSLDKNAAPSYVTIKVSLEK